MSRIRALIAFAVAVCSTASSVRADEPFRFPERKLSPKAELKYRNHLPVLTVEGTPEEIGAATGELALKPAKRVATYPKDVVKEFSAELLWPLFVRVGRRMYERFPENFKSEIAATIKASGAAPDMVITGNTLFDVKKFVMCSSLLVEADRSATGGPLLGRNLDYPSLGYAQEYSLVTVYKQKGKHAFVSVGFPGLSGCLSGMNDAGLCVAVNEMFSARPGEGRFNVKGLPYALCYRTLLEECSTIEEAKKKLESLPRTTLNALSVADRTGVAVFEITPKSVVMRRPKEGIAACTNHFETEVKAEKQLDMGATFERLDYLESTRRLKRKIELRDVQARLHAVSSSFTLQTMIFEPRTLKMHLAIGDVPSSGQQLRTLELAPLFKK